MFYSYRKAKFDANGKLSCKIGSLVQGWNVNLKRITNIPEVKRIQKILIGIVKPDK
jgi:hypothetical protein